MSKQLAEIGMVGLGVMGRNLVLNIADHGYSVVGYDKDPNRVQALQKESVGKSVLGAMTPKEFIASLRTPRAVMMLVPAGKIVDNVIRDLLPLLERSDLIVDGGNSYFKDTDLRAQMLAKKGIHYLGVGISGGEAGARHGPSMMPGGPPDAYARVRAIFEAVAANANGDPCVTYLGPGSAGHYVKMVHNGIEYGLMRLIAETYDLMKRGMGLTDDELADVYALWNRGDLNSYLIEITANIFRQVDVKTDKRLVDVILDEAKQKGTGKWTSQDAMDLGVPVPTIDVAVAMRNLSVYKNEREEANLLLTRAVHPFKGDRAAMLEHVQRALYASTIIVFAQGMALLLKASSVYDYHLNLQDVARIWRGGCIIRAALLEKIRAADRAQPGLPNLLLETKFVQEVLAREEDLRNVVCTATEWGIPVTALGVSLSYLDAYRSAEMPANLIQAQRDYFGAHTYERFDTKGVFHTEWGEA